jgi:hypothetical protein
MAIDGHPMAIMISMAIISATMNDDDTNDTATVEKDEEIARALHEQFRAEAATETAKGVATARQLDQEESDAALVTDVPSRPDGELRAAAGLASSACSNDADVAWRLDREESDAALAADVPSRPDGDLYTDDGELYTDDAAVARRLDQEERDAVLAAEVSSRPGGELYAAAPFASADDADDEAVAWRLEQEERDEVDAALAADLARGLAREGTGGARRRRAGARASRLPLRRLISDTCCAGAVLVVAAFLFVRALHRGAPFSWPVGGRDRDPPAHDPADWFQGGDSYSSTHSGATR